MYHCGLCEGSNFLASLCHMLCAGLCWRRKLIGVFAASFLPCATCCVLDCVGEDSSLVCLLEVAAAMGVEMREGGVLKGGSQAAALQ